MVQTSTVLEKHRKIMALGQMAAKKLGSNALDNNSVEELWDRLIMKVQAEVQPLPAEASNAEEEVRKLKRMFVRMIKEVAQSFSSEIDTSGRKIKDCLIELVQIGIAIGGSEDPTDDEDDPEDEDEIPAEVDTEDYEISKRIASRILGLDLEETQSPRMTDRMQGFDDAAAQAAKVRGSGEMKLPVSFAKVPSVQEKAIARSTAQVDPSDLGGRSLSTRTAYANIAPKVVKRNKEQAQSMADELGIDLGELGSL